MIATVIPAEKDLGVWVSGDLSWNKHVLEGCAKANKLLRFPRRSATEISSRTLYLSVVRPVLGYTS